jgi:hypothetical protein
MRGLRGKADVIGDETAGISIGRDLAGDEFRRLFAKIV